MSETQPVPCDPKCEPRKYFNPFSGYARSGEKERENNCTRALFVALRLIWKERRLAEWMRLLEAKHDQWLRIADILKDPNQTPELRLLSAPKNAAAFAERLVLVISGDPARDWKCGTRKGETAVPDGSISADGGLILVESKSLDEYVDALQIARHVQTIGRLTEPEIARLKEQGDADSNSRNRPEWFKNWRRDLEANERVLEVAWRDIGETLKQWHAAPEFHDTIQAVVEYFRTEGMLGYEGVSQLASFAQTAQSDFALWRETASRAQANDPDKDVSEVQKSDEDLPRNIRRSLELADDQMNEMANKVEQNLGSQWRRENDSNEAASAENQPDAGTSETNLCPIAPKRALRKGYDFTDRHLHWIGPLNRRICIGVDVLDDGLYITSHHWCSVPDFSGISPKDGADLDPQALHAKLTKKRQGALKSITDWCDKWIPLLERPPAAPWKLEASVTPYGFRGASPLWRNPQHYYKNTQQFQLDEVMKVFRTAREAAANNQPPFNCDPASSLFRFDCPELAELSGLDKADLARRLNDLRRLVRKPALSIKIRYGKRAWHDLEEAEDQFFKAIRVMAEWLAPAP